MNFTFYLLAFPTYLPFFPYQENFDAFFQLLRMSFKIKRRNLIGWSFGIVWIGLWILLEKFRRQNLKNWKVSKMDSCQKWKSAKKLKSCYKSWVFPCVELSSVTKFNLVTWSHFEFQLSLQSDISCKFLWFLLLVSIVWFVLHFNVSC
jgi:hypothetical protein